MKTSRFSVATTLVSVGLLAACASTPQLDAQWTLTDRALDNHSFRARGLQTQKRY